MPALIGQSGSCARRFADCLGSVFRGECARARTQPPAAQMNADGCSCDAEQSGYLYKDFSAIEKIGMAVLQIGVSQDAVKKEQGGRGKYQVMQIAPQWPANARAQQGRDNDESQKIKRNRSGEVDLRLKV